MTDMRSNEQRRSASNVSTAKRWNLSYDTGVCWYVRRPHFSGRLCGAHAICDCSIRLRKFLCELSQSLGMKRSTRITAAVATACMTNLYCSPILSAQELTPKHEQTAIRLSPSARVVFTFITLDKGNLRFSFAKDGALLTDGIAGYGITPLSPEALPKQRKVSLLKNVTITFKGRMYRPRMASLPRFFNLHFGEEPSDWNAASGRYSAEAILSNGLAILVPGGDGEVSYNLILTILHGNVNVFVGPNVP